MCATLWAIVVPRCGCEERVRGAHPGRTPTGQPHPRPGALHAHTVAPSWFCGQKQHPHTSATIILTEHHRSNAKTHAPGGLAQQIWKACRHKKILEKKRMHDQCQEGWVECEVSKVRACLALFAPVNKKGACIFTSVLICGAHWGAHATFPSPGRCGLVPPVHSARWGKTVLIPRAQCAPHNAPPAQHARTTGTTRRTNSSRACPSGQHCDMMVFQRRWLCQTTRGQCVGLKSQSWALSQCRGGDQ